MKKFLAVAVILLFIGLAVAPSINAKIDSSSSFLDEKTSENVTVIIGDAHVNFWRLLIDGFLIFGYNGGGGSKLVELEFNANLSEVIIKVVITYVATMDYTGSPPIVLLKPFVAFGLKIENYTDYSWEFFKLKHEKGLFEKKGNVSVEVFINMSNIKKGDMIRLRPTRTIITDPWLITSKDYPNISKYISPLMRFVYEIPRLHDILLIQWILPFYAKFNSRECCSILVYFI